MVSQLLLSSALLVLASAGNAGTLSDTASFIQASMDGNPLLDLWQNYKPPEEVTHDGTFKQTTLEDENKALGEKLQMIRDRLLQNYKPPEELTHDETFKQTTLELKNKTVEEKLQMIRDRLKMMSGLAEKNSKPPEEAMNTIRDRMQVLKNSLGEDGKPSDNVGPAAGDSLSHMLKGLTGEPDSKLQDKVDPMKVAMSMVVDPGSVSKDKMMKAALAVAENVGKQTVKNTLRTKTPFGLGKMIINDKDKEQVHQCSDISSSLYCSMSEKVYGITCAGWGGSSCLDASASCNSITVEGICRRSIERLNVTCLGWGGHKCLPYGATANLITTESICQASEAKLGIRSLGWGGSVCLDKQTVSCEKISVPGICNDAAMRLGVDCAGWSGSQCLSRGAMKCSRITAHHLCSTALKRWHMNCTWHKPGRCADAIA